MSGSFERIQNLAGLIAALNKYRPSLVLALVDTLIEEVISGLQQPSMHTPQASIACTRLLCELYNFQVIKTSHLFNILYLYLTIGSLPTCVVFCAAAFSSTPFDSCVLLYWRAPALPYGMASAALLIYLWHSCVPLNICRVTWILLLLQVK